MNNFQRLQQVDNEYEMADIILYHISNNKRKIFKEDGTVEGLPFLRWLQEEYKE